jgi:hypothetical protein
MKKLLMTETFDTFQLSEATITTFSTFHIDGSFHADYFSSSGDEEFPIEKDSYVLWRRVRPFFFELTRGKHTPLSFRIVFRLAPHNVARLLAQSGISLTADDVDGLFLNVRFDENGLNCISGTSLRLFTLDKSAEHAWDEMLEKFFRQKEIPFC